VVLNNGTGQGTSCQNAAQSEDGQRNKYCAAHKLNITSLPPHSLGLASVVCKWDQNVAAMASAVFVTFLSSADGCIKPIRNISCGSHDAAGSSATDSMDVESVMAY
jgi:hypothetical protein